MKLKKHVQSQPKGTQGKLADDLEISPSWFSKMVNQRSLLSPAIAVARDYLTKGKLTQKDVRPDIFY